MPAQILAEQAVPRIAFVFNAQRHQILHGATTAAALARDWQARVDILSPSQGHLDYARTLAGRYADSDLCYELLGAPSVRSLARMLGRSIPPKLLTLISASRFLNGYDAIVLPERTSTIIRRLGVTHPRLIHVDHGAGDRAVGFDKRIRHFDFVLMAGEKQRERMAAEGLIRPGGYAIVGYPKFEAADLMRDGSWRPFNDARPAVLYNPHFSTEFGSWDRHGIEIVRRIAESGHFNLIVAPHVRLCDNRQTRARIEAALAPFASMPHVHIDLGSDRCVDMTYTTMADAYVGDVSSQIYEFLRTPRPCLFINNDGREWRGDQNYAHWQFGPVIDHAENIVAEIENAIASHGEYLARQQQGFADTFDLHPDEGHSERAAAAIAGFLKLEPRSS